MNVTCKNYYFQYGAEEGGACYRVQSTIFVCGPGMYAGSSSAHHAASVELLTATPSSASAAELPARQHRLDRDLGSPHHLSPLAAMDGARDG